MALGWHFFGCNDRFAFEDGLARDGGQRGTTQPEGIKWFDEPTIGVGLTGDPAIGVAVEQHQHLGLFGASFGDVVAQVDTRRHTALGADLQVKQDEVRLELDDCLANVAAFGDARHGGARFGQSGGNLVEEPICIGSQQHMCHEVQVSAAATKWRDSAVIDLSNLAVPHKTVPTLEVLLTHTVEVNV